MNTAFIFGAALLASLWAISTTVSRILELNDGKTKPDILRFIAAMAVDVSAALLWTWFYYKIH